MGLYRQLDDMLEIIESNNRINNQLFSQHKVKRGLRNSDGTGVLVGLTKIGSVKGYDLVDGKKEASQGKLLYRGIDLNHLVHGFQSENRCGFEEITYLLIFGHLPNENELNYFNKLLDSHRTLPDGFTENMILKIPSKDIMNKIQRSILVLYSHDETPDDTSLKNLVRQSIKLIALLPTIISYGFQAKSHYFNKKSLYIHKPQSGIGTAANILHMIRPDNSYTEKEKEVLDLLLVIHAEHGGGNNSTFTTSVISSTGTDTYSAISAAVGSLKGPKHGGANVKVADMISDIKTHCEYKDLKALEEYLEKILNKEAFDQTGLVYGMGHAVYTKSDPRAELLKQKAYELALEKGQLKDFELYTHIESISKKLFYQKRGPEFHIAANTDLYAGLVYQLLDIPQDLYTPLFATARISGWCAHRIEQILSDPKILRPAYAFVEDDITYEKLNERKIK